MCFEIIENYFRYFVSYVCLVNLRGPISGFSVYINLYVYPSGLDYKIRIIQ